MATALLQKGLVLQAMEAYNAALAVNPGLVRATRAWGPVGVGADPVLARGRGCSSALRAGACPTAAFWPFSPAMLIMCARLCGEKKGEQGARAAGPLRLGLGR